MEDSLDQIDLDPTDLPTLTPRATLTSLPVEIKARIAELAHLQDELFKERWPDRASKKHITEVVLTEWHGKSLSALSQTCRDFNKLASIHAFRTLGGTQIDSAYFQIRILPRHARAIRTIVLKGPQTAQPGLLRALATLRHLPNLDELQLDSVTYTKLFEAKEDDADLAREIIRQIAPRITSLILRDVDPADAVNILTVFSASTVVSVRLNLRWPQSDSVIKLRDMLAAMPQLRALALEDASRPSSPRFNVPLKWSQGAWVAQIRSLTLINAILDDAALAFID